MPFTGTGDRTCKRFVREYVIIQVFALGRYPRSGKQCNQSVSKKRNIVQTTATTPAAAKTKPEKKNSDKNEKFYLQKKKRKNATCKFSISSLSLCMPPKNVCT